MPLTSGMRDLAIAHADGVRQIGEHWNRRVIELAGGLAPGPLERLADDTAGAFEDDRCASGDHAHLDAEILERHSRAERARAVRFGSALTNQHGVDLALDPEIAQAAERREYGAHFGLLRLQRELTELGGRNVPVT